MMDAYIFNVAEKMVYGMFFLGRNFVPDLLIH